MIGIVTIAAQPLIRHGLQHICGEIGDIKVVAEAPNLRKGAFLIEDVQPDCVVIDLPSAPKRAVDTRMLRIVLSRDVPVLALLNPMLPYVQALELLEMGLAGAVKSDVDGMSFEQAVKAVCRGQRYCDMKSYGSARASSYAHRGIRLTEKEVEVLSHVASGFSNREIGDLLYVSQTTVKFHVGNVMRKFGAKRRGELVHLAAPNGIF